MTCLDLSEKILNNVINESVPFDFACKMLKEKNLNHDNVKRSIALSVCALKHYLIFDYVFEKFFPFDDSKLKSGVFSFLSNHIYLKYVQEVTAIKFLTSFLEKNSNNDLKNILDEFISFINDEKNLNPYDIEKEAYDYYSLKYNTPKYLIKMWEKHFSSNLMPLILKSNYYLPKTSFFTLKDDLDILKNSKLLQTPHFYTYLGTKIKEEKDYIHSNIIPVESCYPYLLSKIDIDSLRGVCLFLGERTLFPLLINNCLSNNVKSDLIVSNDNTYFYAKDLINKFQLNNYYLVKADCSCLLTIISKKVHTMIVFPKSSNFSMIRYNPDFFLRFKKEDLDELILNEYNALLEASKYVEDEGTIIYCVSTMNQKEGRGIVKKFLTENTDFILQEEKQFLPFDKYQSCFYFAIMNKTKGSNND